MEAAKNGLKAVLKKISEPTDQASGPLAKGLMLGDEIRCPLHHACFSLRTGVETFFSIISALNDYIGKKCGEQNSG